MCIRCNSSFMRVLVTIFPLNIRCALCIYNLFSVHYDCEDIFFAAIQMYPLSEEIPLKTSEKWPAEPTSLTKIQNHLAAQNVEKLIPQCTSFFF